VNYSDFELKDSINCDFIFTIIFLTRRFIICKFCENEFSSNFRLHKHISFCISKTKITVLFFESDSIEKFIESRIIITFMTSAIEKIDYAFRKFQYVTINISFDLNEIKDEICLDINCIMTLKDWKYLESRLFNYQFKVKCMTLLISV